MKPYHLLFSAVLLLALMLSGCAGQPVQLPAAEAPATEAPVTVPPIQVPVNIAGPLMEVGSTFRYLDGVLLVAVPGGKSIVGHRGEDNPKREVTLGDFWIYQTEVTNRQFALCVAVGECAPPDLTDNRTYTDPFYANDPVVGLNHNQAASYCGWVNGRLPTNEEWEKAARGPEGRLYPWGDNAPGCDLLNSGNCVGKPTNVEAYPLGKSYYEVLDMAGNSFEWVSNWYASVFDTSASTENPTGPTLGEKRAVRSTGFSSSFFEAESARLWSLKPTEHRIDLSFRCVIEDPTFFAPMCEQLVFYGLGPDGKPVNYKPTRKCVDPTIKQGQKCGEPTIVTFDPSAGVSFDADGCDPVPGEPNKFVCFPGDGPINSCGSCSITDPGESQCSDPANYTKVGDKCIWNGGTTGSSECIGGTIYDPVNQCCAASPGSGADFNICPAGFYPFLGGCAKVTSGIPVCTGDVGVDFMLPPCGGDVTDGGEPTDGGQPCVGYNCY